MAAGHGSYRRHTGLMGDHPPSRPSLLGRLRPQRDEHALTALEQAIMVRVRELAHLELQDVMTPRVDVITLTQPVTPDQVADAVRDTGHSCFPVISDDLDDVVGVLLVNDLFRSSSTRRTLGAALPSTTEIARKIRRPLVLPETMGVLDALEEMRRQRRTFAVVADEHGGVAGVVSTRDLLEPLVGELSDEFDEDDEPVIAKLREDRWLIDGTTHCDKVADTLGYEIPDGEYVTIAGFIIEGLGKIPEIGNTFRHGPYLFKVHAMDKRRVEELICYFDPDRLLDPPKEGAGESE